MEAVTAVDVGFFAKWGGTLVVAAIGLAAVGAMWFYMNRRLQKETKKLRRTQSMYATQLESMAEARARQLISGGSASATPATGAGIPQPKGPKVGGGSSEEESSSSSEEEEVNGTTTDNQEPEDDPGQNVPADDSTDTEAE